jgi:hypothetical protein
MHKRVCVYCSSSDIIEDKYKEAAEQFARAASNAGISIVCGGSSKGLMGVMIDTALECGGEIEGVMPEFMTNLEFDHRRLTKLTKVKTMSERKDLLRDDTDSVIVFPGGIGTLEEFIETFTLKRLGKYSGTVILYNLDGFYNPLISLFDHLVEKCFLNSNYHNGLIVVETVDELIKEILSSERFFLEPKHYAPHKS